MNLQTQVFGIALKWIALAVLVLALIGLVLWYGSTRYKAGENHADKQWVEAGQKLEEEARTATDQATANSAKRIETHNQKVEAEKEKLNEAEANGSSPFDVLFGPIS